MSTMSEEQARDYMHKAVAAMVKAGDSDLFIAHDYPPSIKAHGQMTPLAQQNAERRGHRPPGRRTDEFAAAR